MMALEIFYTIATEQIKQVRNTVIPINQFSGRSRISDQGLIQFGNERSNLRPLSPRSRAWNVEKAGAGHCDELAMALLQKLITAFAGYPFVRCFKAGTTEQNSDHAFCVVFTNISQDNAAISCLFEVDAWHPRIEFVETYDVNTGKFVSKQYGTCSAHTKTLYCNADSFLRHHSYYNQQIPPPEKVNYGPFQQRKLLRSLSDPNLYSHCYSDHAISEQEFTAQRQKASQLIRHKALQLRSTPIYYL